jgi:hypothetical protein
VELRNGGEQAEGTRAEGTRAEGTRAEGTRAEGTRAKGHARTADPGEVQAIVEDAAVPPVGQVVEEGEGRDGVCATRERAVGAAHDTCGGSRAEEAARCAVGFVP